jgi:hypothetical protein
MACRVMGGVPSHGGKSLKPAAPKTAAGIAAIKAGQARRWAAYRADKLAGRRLGRPKLPVKPPRPARPKSVGRPVILTQADIEFAKKIGMKLPKGITT